MKIQHTSGGFAEVSEETAEKLLKFGHWRLPRKPRATKSPAPEVEPQTEE